LQSQVYHDRDNLIERVDSGATDESPFGSSLTTPVDEDIQLFHGIEERLMAKGEVEHVGTYGSAVIVEEQDGLNALSNTDLKMQEFSKNLLENVKVRPRPFGWGVLMSYSRLAVRPRAHGADSFCIIKS
jgi:hypothetical protein